MIRNIQDVLDFEVELYQATERTEREDKALEAIQFLLTRFEQLIQKEDMKRNLFSRRNK